MRSAREEARNLRRVWYVTENYHLLQGLKWVPWGIWLLLGAGWWNWYETWRPISVFLALIPALLTIWLIDIYYRRTFGWTDAGQTNQAQLVGLMLLGGAMFVAGFVDGRLQPLISIFGLTVATMMFFYFRLTVGLKFHRVAVVLAIATSSFLPLSDLVSYEQFSAILGAVLGISFIFVGLVDHLLLVRDMQPLPEDDYEIH